MSMEQKTVKYQTKGAIAVITLNRPEKLNAQNALMAQELLEAFKKAAADTEVRAVVFRGEGRAFCSGHDLTEETDKIPWRGNLQPSNSSRKSPVQSWAWGNPWLWLSRGMLWGRDASGL